MATSERRIQVDVRIALGALDGCVFWRNNCGVCIHPNGDRTAYGLGRGSADLVGIVDGRFFALELKTARGRTSAQQDMWLQCVRMHNGFACVVRSVDEALAAVERCRAGELE